MDEIEALLALQDGVIARRQVLAAGLTPTHVARKVRRREWVPVHPGVYVDHTGSLTWSQRAWAAVLACWPAALDGRSALRANEGPGRRGADDSSSIEIVVAHGRHPVEPDGVRVRSSRRFDDAIQQNLSPPRLRYDAAVIDLADDGRLNHDSTRARDIDLERDLDAALEREHTVRLGYGQVFRRACSTAAKVGQLLQIRGWAGAPAPCPLCEGSDRRGSDQAG